MIKLIGILLLCSSVSAYGAYLSSEVTKGAKQRNEITEFIKHIHNGIKYERMPLDKIYALYSSVQLEKCGFLEGIRRKMPEDALIDDTLFLLCDDEKQMLKHLLSQLGKSHFSEREQNLLSSCLDFFTEKQQKMQKETAAKSLLYKKLGLIVSLLCAIILI